MVTGTRAEFGLLEPVLQALASRGRVESRLIVTGMHLLTKFGHTVDEIRARGWRVDAAVRMQTGRDDGSAEAGALGRGIERISKAIDRLHCDTVLVLGDPIEAFAGATAGAVSRRVVAHIHGGDRAPGDIDDQLRNAISRLAHVHLVASRDAARRLARMGEPADRIHIVGAPGLDAIREFLAKPPHPGTLKLCDSGTTKRQKAGKTSIAPASPYAVLVLHPCGRKPAVEAAVARAAMTAIERNGLAGVAIWPNSDPGHTGVIAEYEKQTNRSGWRVFKSLPREDYLRLVTGAAVLVGNSSSGIIESASLGVNAVNIGPRQAGRLRCGKNVVESGESLPAISRATRTALAKPRPVAGRSVYGDGHAGERIARILESLPVQLSRLAKNLTY